MLKKPVVDGMVTQANGLTRTAVPTGGFPKLQLLESPFKNIDNDLKNLWLAKPGPKVWVRLWRPQYQDNWVETVNQLCQTVAKLITGRETTISPPTRCDDYNQNDLSKAPYHLLISNLSKDDMQKLVDFKVVSTPEITFFTLPFDVPLPNYITTIENLIYEDSDSTNTKIASVVTKRLSNAPDVTADTTAARLCLKIHKFHSFVNKRI